MKGGELPFLIQDHLARKLVTKADLDAIALKVSGQAPKLTLSALVTMALTECDVENTFQVPAELKKQQREAPFKAPQMDAPVQYTVLAENPATNPADAHTV
jgi:hypothetical protein